MTPADIRPLPGRPRQSAVRLMGWLQRHFFNGWHNTVLVVLALWLLVSTLPDMWQWLITNSTLAPAVYADCAASGGACWAYLQAKWRLILFGTFPYDEQWRAGLSVLLLTAALALSCLQRIFAHARRAAAMAALWLLVLFSVAVLMRGGVFGLSDVPSRLWSGLPLTLGLAVLGCVSAFLLAILLALGRRCPMPVLRWLSIGYIEFIRGVPLIGLLFLATILFPLLVPPEVDVDKLLRAQLAFILFFAAYMAEAIRGGLQSIPLGQYAAAHAIGLGYWRTHIYIVLPQALRLCMPSLVNIFIAAFKDTSLVTVVSMMDLLGTANAAKSDSAWLGLYIESYLMVAAIYFFFCFCLSWQSRRIERALAVGGRSTNTNPGP